MKNKTANAIVLVVLLIVNVVLIACLPFGLMTEAAGASSDAFSILAPSVSDLTATISGGANTSRINYIQWDWGDGSSSASWFPASHTYEVSGSYWINATAHFSDQNILSTFAYVRVHTGDQLSLFPPAINSSTTDGTSIVDVNGGASAGQTHAVTQIQFSWGDELFSTGWFPQSHQYAQNGNYFLTVTAYFSDETTAATSVAINSNSGQLSDGNTLQINATSGGSIVYQSSLGSSTIPAGNSKTLYLATADNLELTTYPTQGNHFTSWTTTGAIQLSSPATTLTPNVTIIVNSAATITANFAVTNNATITLSTTQGGYTNPNPGNYTQNVGSTFYATATPYQGYSFAYWLLNENAYSSSTSTSVLIDNNYTLQAIFTGATSQPIYISNNIMGVTIQNGALGTGTFTIKTDSGHPSPNQNVLYGGAGESPGTSFTTFRVEDTLREYVTLTTGSTTSSEGYTLRSLDECSPVASQISSTAAAITWTTTENLTITLLLSVHGTTVSDTAVEMTVTIQNNAATTHSVAVRHELDLMVDGSDNSWIRTWTNPSTSQPWTSTEAVWNQPAFQFWETTNNPTNPLFSIYGSTSLPNTSPPPTVPDRLTYASWGNAYDTAYDYQPYGYSGMDSAILYYWSAQPIRPGQQISHTAYLTTVVQSTLSSLAWATNSDGTQQDTFQQSASIYVAGSNFTANTNVNIYLIPDGQQATPANSVANSSATTTATGTLPKTLFWPSAQTPGQYDIWIDTNKNGIFDTGDVWNNQAGGIYAFNVISATTQTLTMYTVGAGTVQPGNATYPTGTSVNLIAIPAPGWSFQGWNGSTTGSTNKTITMNGEKTITATFVQNTYILTISVIGQGSVNKNVTQPYFQNQVILLNATAQTGWQFDHWSGSLTGNANPAMVILTSNITVVATFIQNSSTTNNLIILSGIGGLTDISPGNYMLEIGSNISVTAWPNWGYSFSGWLLDGNESGNANPIWITMDRDHTLKPIFTNGLTHPVAYTSATTINQGQSSTLTATNIAGGTTPYSYQWLWKVPGGSLFSPIIGATADVYNFTTSDSTAPGVYSFVLQLNDSANQQVVSNVVQVQVNAALTVAILPSNASMNVGQSRMFTSSISGGSGTLSYQWFLNGSAVSGATDQTWTFTASSTGSYSVYLRVTDQASLPVTVQSNVSAVTVNPAPSVAASPSAWNITAGQTQTFTAQTSGGTTPYSYQWLWETPGANSYIPISTATSSVYSFSTSASTTLGTYFLILQVTDATGQQATSNTIQLQVNGMLAVTISPSLTSMDLGQSQVFTASASGGTGTLSYQWYLNNSPITGQTSPTYTFIASTAGSSFIYVSVTDQSSTPQTTKSNNATITIISPLEASTASAIPSQITQGQTITLSATTASGGTSPYSYQWLAKAPSATTFTPIIGATTTTYSLTTSTTTTTGLWSFTLLTTDARGATAYSNTITSTVTATSTPSLTAPNIHASATTINQSQASTLTTDPVTGGKTPYSYRWLEKSPDSTTYSPISGANSNLFTFSTSNSTTIGTYSFELQVTDSLGATATSSAIVVTVNSPSYVALSVFVSPINAILGLGQAQILSATPSGGIAPFAFQWYQNGTIVAGDTTSTFTFTPTKTGTTAFYVQLTDSLGKTATSNIATVTVNAQLTSPTLNASQLIIDQGQSVTLTATSLNIIEPTKNVGINSPKITNAAFHKQGLILVQTGQLADDETQIHSLQWLQKPPGAETYTQVSGATAAIYTFTTTNSTTVGAWTFELQITYTTGVTVTSSPVTVTVNPQLNPPSAAAATSDGNPINTINQGDSFLLTSAQVSSGTQPYAYQWYMKAPRHDTYTTIYSATAPTYDFATAAATQTGTWHFLLQVTDHAGATVNSTEIVLQVNSTSTRLSQSNPSIWVPDTTSAIEATVVSVAAVGVVSAIIGTAAEGTAEASEGFLSRLQELLPEGIKKWTEDFVKSKRKISVKEKKAKSLLPTKPELLAYGVGIAVLTVCFAYIKTPSVDQMLQIIPIILATSILVEVAKNYGASIYARSRGVWTEHKVWYTGIVLLFITSFAFRLPFSKPSRNVHPHDHSKEAEKTEGYISSVEVIIILWFATAFFILLLSGFVLIGATGLGMCITHALFDTFPIRPMNGNKIYRHSKLIWAGIFALTVTLYVLWILLL
jgi:hypothetical protein